VYRERIVRKLVRLFALPLLLVSLAVGQSDTVNPNENLVVEGIPPISSSLASSVERYSNFRSASLQDWNPGRREIMITTRFADTNQLHLVKMPAGARTQLTFFSEPVANARYEPVSGKFLVFSKDVGGGEFYQFYRLDADTGDIALLTDGKSRNTGKLWSNAGDKLAYGSTRRNGKDVDLWVMDPAQPDTNHMLAQLEGGGWEPLDWSPDDRTILVIEEISANESYLWLFDATSGAKTLLTPKGRSEKISYSGGKFAKDNKGIYTTSDKDSEYHRLTWIDLASKQHTYLTGQIPWDVDEFDLSHDGKTIAFVSNEDGYGVLHLLDTATRREKPVPQLPKGIISGVRWHKNSRDLGFNLSSARSDLDVYSLNIETAAIERWTQSETGGPNPERFSEPELIHWKTWDGRNISGLLYRAPAKFTGKRPVMIDIHGGPESQSRPGFLSGLNYYLNELGISLIFPNVRGSAGYGKSFLALDNGFLREGSYEDINSLLDWIQTQSDLDSSRVLVIGGSYGGFMTLAVATNYNQRICCSVDIVGISNLVTFLEHTSGYRQDLRRVEYGDERDPKMRVFLETISPLNKAKNITKPLFVIAGKNDPRVPEGESKQMVDTVRKNGTPVWYLLAKDEGHGFRKKKNRDYQFYATVTFVKEFLLK
jgi:dipeptidyl aminopeptidase/acylaminoacyl peptidase